ncbi:hypothetical protein MHC_03790 [Mycoplasma haemocanis str. Illinois]|uniref:Uncharacterized protein n=1 Tax=Mycoplasma haemocanis (strain Illinois) TaxID=1111676 RepID=H6N7J6_MYCHN|nr:hypothetical protein [Mycoplasma haemocanis]AEW45618.1 hypothetical protein MHC_03790 [Mycoplasma haemocanis str. Illinois]
MNTIVKGAIVIIGAAGSVGGGYLISQNISKTDTIANHLKAEYLLTKEQTDKWNHRVGLLKKAQDGDLDESLLPLKKDGLTNKELQDWCFANLKERFEGTKSSKFLNVRLYCGLNMGDKISGNKVSSSTTDSETKLATNFSKLNGKTEQELGSELLGIGKKTNQSSGWEGNKALKEWCLKTFDLAFEEISIDYTNAKTYCVLAS